MIVGVEDDMDKQNDENNVRIFNNVISRISSLRQRKEKNNHSWWVVVVVCLCVFNEEPELLYTKQNKRLVEVVTWPHITHIHMERVWSEWEGETGQISGDQETMIWVLVS